MKEVKHLIIGAGVSGLGFAKFVNSEDYLILEKESDAGGYCRTIYRDDFVWDYAGHFFHFANDDLKKFFYSKIKKEDLVFRKKNTKIFYNGTYIDYPFQKNIHQLDKKEFIHCLYDLFNKEEKDTYLGFEDMLYGKFGKAITDKFLKPYNEKLYACNLNVLDPNAMGRFFPYANIKEIIDNMMLESDTSYNKEFLYPKKGAVTFVNVLLNELDQNKILYNQEVIKIDVSKKIVQTVSDSFKYEHLINTSPFEQLIKYTEIEEYNKKRERFTYNKVLVFNLGFDKKSNIKDIHWVYIPDKDINFYRIGFYDNILNSDKLSMYVEIGYNSNTKIDVNKQLALTIKNLKKMKVIDEQKLIANSHIIMDPAYVHISKSGKILKEKIKEELVTRQLFTIGRYGDWKYCSIEDSLLDAIYLANSLNENY
ncbi:NAD(P)-binding protein [Mycoplasmatota bacterium WC44]